MKIKLLTMRIQKIKLTIHLKYIQIENKIKSKYNFLKEYHRNIKRIY